ncbi:hypothetical protein [Mycobacteroides abscessus]|uniref:hypothetical protein n=1 Tax=Mycobacteroides abscessus TaxID=36809 RepID=UPI001041CB22|nr:hypothetical protein [Mycobacteroides abscessus]
MWVEKAVFTGLGKRELSEFFGDFFDTLRDLSAVVFAHVPGGRRGAQVEMTLPLGGSADDGPVVAVGDGASGSSV